MATSHRHRHHYRRRRHHRRFRTSYVRMLTRTRTHTQSNARMRMRTSCECHDIVPIDDVVYDFTAFLANPEGMILRSLERLLPNSITCNVYDDCIDYPPDDDDYDDDDYFGYMLIMVAHGVFVVSLGEPLCVRQYTHRHTRNRTHANTTGRRRLPMTHTCSGEMMCAHHVLCSPLVRRCNQALQNVATVGGWSNYDDSLAITSF